MLKLMKTLATTTALMLTGVACYALLTLVIQQSAPVLAGAVIVAGALGIFGLTASAFAWLVS